MSDSRIEKYIAKSKATSDFKFKDVAEHRTVEYAEPGARKSPSKDDIRAYWAKWLLSPEANSTSYLGDTIEEFWYEGECCFACGRDRDLEKAHILPRCEGGSDELSNFHLLCHACHSQSEYIHGAQYLEWFQGKEFFFNDLWKTLSSLVNEKSTLAEVKTAADFASFQIRQPIAAVPWRESVASV